MSQESDTMTPIANGIPAERLDVRALAVDDLPFVRHSWFEAYHRAPQRASIPWSAFKATYGVIIDQLLAREDLWVLGAYNQAGRVRGWIAWTPGSVPVVHYCYVRREERRQGLASRLIDDAGLGKRLVFCWRGVKPKRGESMDHVLVASLARRGVSAVYVPVRDVIARTR